MSHMPARPSVFRRLLTPAAALLGLGLMVGASAAQAQEEQITFLRIGTGPTGGTYFPIGGTIANAVSNPPGSRPCDKGGSCGIPGVIAVAQSTAGSVENIQGLRTGQLDLALVQADVTYRAAKGEGSFKPVGPFDGLRALAWLYPESLQVVARADAGIASIKDLKGKRVSIGATESGTLVEALRVLSAYGLSVKAIKAEYMDPGTAADALARGALDAFFDVSGVPTRAVADLADKTAVVLVPVDGPERGKLVAETPYMVAGSIAAETYKGVPATETINVGALLVTTTGMSDDMAYGVVRALWHPNTEKLLAHSHPKAAAMSLANARLGLAIALHPGAEKYYAEVDAAAKAEAEEEKPEEEKPAAESAEEEEKPVEEAPKAE